MHVHPLEDLGQNSAERILRGLLAGDAVALVAAFEPPGHLADPLAGDVTGPQALGALARHWLSQREVSAAELGPLREMITPERCVTECVLLLHHRSGAVTLPVAIVADLAGDGRARAARIYHSIRPLTGAQRGRFRLLPEDASLVLPGVLQRLDRALRERDADAAVGCFDEQGYVRGPTGHRFYGPAGLRVFFGALSAFAPLRLSCSTATVDAADVAVEHTIIPENLEGIEAQAGLAVFRMGTDGKLRFVRLYNDLQVPQLPVAFEISDDWYDADLEPTKDRSGYFRPQHYHGHS